MASADYILHLLDPSVIAMVATAAAAVVLSARRSLHVYHQEAVDLAMHRSSSPQLSVTLQSSHAVLFPVMACCLLLLLFYLFSKISMFLTLLATVAACSSLTVALSPLAPAFARVLAGLPCAYNIWLPPVKGKPITSHAFSLLQFVFRPFLHCRNLIASCLKPSLATHPPPSNLVLRAHSLILLFSLSLTAAWLLSGHWFLNNCLGFALCLTFASHLRLPNLRVASLLLGALLLYDVFWVFLSERWFGVNVMVAVAVKQVPQRGNRREGGMEEWREGEREVT